MLRWFDGFEHYGVKARMLEGVGGAAAWSEVGGCFALSTTNPATGTSHVRLTETTTLPAHMRRALGQASQVSGVGYRLAVEDLPDTEGYASSDFQLVLLDVRDVANVNNCRFSMGTDGSVYFCRGSTLLGRSNPCIAPGGYHHFEAKTKIDNSTGYGEVRVNEVTVLNVTGVDTQNTANAATAQVAVRNQATTLGNAGFGFMDIDDVFAWDDDAGDAANGIVDFIGDKGCYYLPATADTAEADWTKSTGVTGYSLIDEVSVDDADYIADTTGVARSVFAVAALPSNVSEVIAMMPVIRARKEDSGTVGLRGGVVVDTSESYSPGNSPSTQFAYMTPGPKTIDPDTGVAWASDASPQLLIERTE